MSAYTDYMAGYFRAESLEFLRNTHTSKFAMRNPNCSDDYINPRWINILTGEQFKKTEMGYKVMASFIEGFPTGIFRNKEGELVDYKDKSVCRWGKRELVKLFREGPEDTSATYFSIVYDLENGVWENKKTEEDHQRNLALFDITREEEE